MESDYIVDKITAHLWLQDFYCTNKMISEGKELDNQRKTKIILMADICREIGVNPAVDGIILIMLIFYVG